MNTITITIIAIVFLFFIFVSITKNKKKIYVDTSTNHKYIYLHKIIKPSGEEFHLLLSIRKNTIEYVPDIIFMWYFKEI